jgi:hypothetical protein
MNGKEKKKKINNNIYIIFFFFWFEGVTWLRPPALIKLSYYRRFLHYCLLSLWCRLLGSVFVDNLEIWLRFWILRSLWRLLLVKYQGADVTRRRHIDWNAWIVRVFDGLAAPHI